MTEQELRALVRQAIAYHLNGRTMSPQVPAPHAAAPSGRASGTHPAHISHGLLALAAVEAGSPCVIEPAVSCNQCGFCKSFGH